MGCCRGRKMQFLPALIVLMVLASPLCGLAAQQSGKVQSGETPVAFSTVTLYSAERPQSSSPIILGKAQSDANGVFHIPFTPPSNSTAVLYLIANGGSPLPASQGAKPLRGALRLATVLGTTPVPSEVVINERTTVASAYALAQFIAGQKIAGKAPGLQNAAATVHNLVDVTTGHVGAVLGNPPNGLETSTLRAFNSLANMLAACVKASTPTPCVSLFDLATPPGGRTPSDTLQAVVNIAHYPWQNVEGLFDQSQILMLYGPALESSPDAWTLAIRYIGNGHEFDGPGNIAVDKDGNIWVTNNYEFNPDPFGTVCGDNHLIKLTPTGVDAPGAPYEGGGLYGAGFGITIDPKGDVWIGNFGFQGSTCKQPKRDSSVSQFSADGTALSPAIIGFPQGNIKQPQGTVSDQQGNIWITNCGNDSITQFPDGNPHEARNFSNIGLDKPFGIAIDAKGRAWITSNQNNSVVILAPDGSPVAGSPFTGGGLKAPMGIAIDSLGNAWVTNSGLLDPPCPTVQIPSPGGESITLLRHNGQPAHSSPFTGGGLTLPWGVAVDGNDNIWVANFGGQRLSQFCGARTSKCPPGYRTGDPISPDTGYTSDGLTRNTGIAIDPSGNVWLVNNWLNVPVQTNPGGHEMVVFIGLAAPIKTPLIGPPQRP